jgi:hypothetical protein
LRYLINEIDLQKKQTKILVASVWVIMKCT